MKPKTFHKKLNLNKKTIAKLDRKELKKINGGWIPTINPSYALCCQQALIESECEPWNLGGKLTIFKKA